MYAYKYDSITHAEHDILCPLSRHKIDTVIELLALRPGAKVLDLAAGKGELFLRVLERYQAGGDAIEPSPLYQAQLRAEVAGRVPPESVRLIEGEAYELEVDNESYDLIICLANRPYGDLRETFARAWAMVRTGGQLLVGEWHWSDDEPNPDYIDFLGCGEDAYCTHDQIVTLGVKEDFTPIYQTTATRDEIDHYEGLSTLAAERWLRGNPGDPHASAVRERSRKWRDAYLKWGRYELGFGLYLFLK
jgi:ubiquinone/menaquinone biosynthesis C-methylase UbiE